MAAGGPAVGRSDELSAHLTEPRRILSVFPLTAEVKSVDRGEPIPNAPDLRFQRSEGGAVHTWAWRRGRFLDFGGAGRLLCCG